MPLSLPDLHRASNAIAWFHSIDLGEGYWTDGRKTRQQMEAELELWKFPSDLSGKTVLDIGCADGGWSVAAIRRGARWVLSIDAHMDAGIRFLIDNKVFPLEYRRIDLFSRAFMDLPVFDVIIFAGVLYHVQDPMEALKRIRTKVHELVIFETHINESLGSSLPYAIFYENDEANKDHTNWWGFNILCLEAMLRTAGFRATKASVTTHSLSDSRICYHLQPIDRDQQSQQAADSRVIGGSPFEGYLDICTDNLIAGWVWNTQNPATHCAVDIVARGKLLARVTASDFRQDLRDNGIGNGAYGFSFTPLLPLDSSEVSVAISGTDVAQLLTARGVLCPQQTAQLLSR
jgi:tRNA (mo5U34)-methyltransferase